MRSTADGSRVYLNGMGFVFSFIHKILTLNRGFRKCINFGPFGYLSEILSFVIKFGVV